MQCVVLNWILDCIHIQKNSHRGHDWDIGGNGNRDCRLANRIISMLSFPGEELYCVSVGDCHCSQEVPAEGFGIELSVTFS